MPQSHTSTQQWQSFELRMRRRRVQRCVQRAGEALAARKVVEARDAIAEAQLLDPEDAEVLALRARLEHLPAAPRRRAAAWRALGAAALVVLTAGVGWFWTGTRETTESAAPDVMVARHLPPQALADSAPAGVPDNGDPAPPSSAVTEEIAVPPVSDAPEPRTEAREESSASVPAAARAAPAPAPAERPGPSRDATGTAGVQRTERVTAAGGRATQATARQTPADPPPPAARTSPPAAARTSPPAAAPPEPEEDASPVLAVLPEGPAVALNLPSTPARPDPLPAAPAVAAREAASAPAVADERLVRATLNRYQAAYSDLDAAAAGAVWPSVDRRALARAFDGLTAQSVSLGQCNVHVSGAAATAECSGQARWTPKVGGGTQSAARQWRFELSQKGDQWLITHATVR